MKKVGIIVSILIASLIISTLIIAGTSPQDPPKKTDKKVSCQSADACKTVGHTCGSACKTEAEHKKDCACGKEGEQCKNACEGTECAAKHAQSECKGHEAGQCTKKTADKKK